MISASIFKAYDIRGIYPLEIDEKTVFQIARAFAVLRQKELGREKLKIVVGQDMRLSSPALAEAVKKGLVQQGIEVINIGLTATPTFYFAVSFFGDDGGIMITASHNPREYNGLKLVREGAKSLGSGSGMEELKELALAGNFPDIHEKGKISARENILAEQIKLAGQFADLEKIKPLKIVLDTANAMGILYLEALFQKLPQIALIKLNERLDGTFPAHQPDPLKEENLTEIKKRVVEEKADLGLATDGDGDRIFFIDDKGEVVEPAIMRGIFARLFLRQHPGAMICYDIRPGKITEDMILEAGGHPSITRVGHSLIKKQMIETNAVFGGESSGHFFVRFPSGVYEAPEVVTLKLLQELSEIGLSLSEYIKPLKRYFHSGEINFKVMDKEKILARLKEKYADAQINDLDGLAFTYPDFWFNVRASNTESLLRLNLEARSQALMEEKMGEVKKIIEEA